MKSLFLALIVVANFYFIESVNAACFFGMGSCDRSSNDSHLFLDPYRHDREPSQDNYRQQQQWQEQMRQQQYYIQQQRQEQMRQQPSLPQQSTERYFVQNGANCYTGGDNLFCCFFSAESYQSHRSARPNAMSGGNASGIPYYTGACR